MQMTLVGKTQQIIAVAVAHVTQCPYCIKGYTKAACRVGASPQEHMEAIWVAAEMRAGAAPDGVEGGALCQPGADNCSTHENRP